MVDETKETLRVVLLNLLLLPILAALGLFDTDGAGTGAADGGGDGAAAAGSATPPATGTDGAAAAGDATAAKPKDDAAADEPLGEPGKKALEQERSARKAAEKRAKDAESEAERVRTANQTEAEKALTDAKKTATAEERAKWESRAIRAEAKSALSGLGAADVGVAVAAFLDEHRDLKVDDDGAIEGLDATVKAFKNAHPTLFTARVPGGSADQGAKPPADKRATSLEDAYEAHYAQRTQH